MAVAKSSDAILRFENVTRLFPTGGGVSDVTLGLSQGEILTLLGPSGCGKTTTLRIAMGLEHARSGRVVYKECVVDSPSEKIFVPPEKRDMGMVFQSYAIWPHMTVFDNVAFPMRARKYKKEAIRQRVAEVLELVGLANYGTRPGMQLSGGQAQRVAVARALSCNPDVLLMDEPFSNIDAKLREQMRVELRLLQRQLGFSILFVTHDQAEAMALSDRIAVMDSGKIEQFGSPKELYSAPTTPFVRDFLGRSILLEGHIAERAGDGARVQLAAGVTLTVKGGDHTGGKGAGENCIVAIRPEEITVVPANEANADAGVNGLSTAVRVLLFVGEYYDANVETTDGKILFLRLPRTREWQEGERIILNMPPEKLHLWNRE